MNASTLHSSSPFSFYSGPLVLSIALSLLLHAQTGMGQDPLSLPRLMDQEPKFVFVEPKIELSDKTVALWVDALCSKNVNLQRQAAESISIAQARGIGKFQQAHRALIEKLEKQDTHPLVRVAVAKAIIALELKETANTLLDLAKSSDDLDLSGIVQTALADWRVESAKEFWQAQLASTQTGHREKSWAITGLTSISDKSVVDSLKSIVEEASSDYRVRFVAADALGQLVDQGLFAISAKLQKSTLTPERLLAAKLIKRHTDEESLKLALSLAQDADPAVASIAWSNLLQSPNVRALDTLAEFGIGNRGPKVRRFVADLLKIWHDKAACQKLGVLLSDLHPDVRNHAREILLNFAKDAPLRDDVIESAMSRLATNWQGIQQALLILTELDHKPAATQFISLLDHPRAEVHVTSGWALERLSVPETLDPVFKRAEALVESIKSGKASSYSKSEYESLAHLIQLLGKNKYREMEKVIIPKLIPKDMILLEYPIRPAAIWSLGMIYDEQELPQKYLDSLLERLMDEDPNNPEHTYVKSMCTFVFAKAMVRSKISNIERYAKSNSANSRFGHYCNWSLNQLDGRPMPVVKPAIRNDVDWFLAPIE